LEEVGFIDSDNYFFYHADGDLCLRMADIGYRCIDSPESYIEHFSEANTEVRASNLERQQKDWAAYKSRWESLGAPEQDWMEKDFDDHSKTAKKYWVKPKSILRRFGK
jgi:GT2 family glycosyltransferase